MSNCLENLFEEITALCPEVFILSLSGMFGDFMITCLPGSFVSDSSGLPLSL